MFCWAAATFSGNTYIKYYRLTNLHINAITFMKLPFGMEDIMA
jgi:hypothetical protein